ncbi:hypothetical protein [Roseibium aggregatum]|uniref:Uncharacterized protein n=1 Tax=Roseibium aggregatum TaxID=187304 RepID=A0A926NW90_9HYPH|nr:hypothetical protein [Roseibium aggregatum]MBD1548532.1 hypothetical protein [Roseibium aggregatum]
MGWENLVPGCFGAADARFALHATDEKRAKEAIKAAKTAGASFEDFEKEILWYCYQKVSHDGFLGHVEEQVAEAKKLWR